jgi:hypothetical protein
VRQVVYSAANKNYKLEISQGKGLNYPATPPVIVFVERQLRTFDYMLVMPGDAGYAQLVSVTSAHPPVGKGMLRVIVDAPVLRAVWPTTPVLAGVAEVEEDGL